MSIESPVAAAMELRLAYLAKAVKPENAYLATRRLIKPPGAAMAQKHETPREAGLILETTFLVTQPCGALLR